MKAWLFGLLLLIVGVAQAETIANSGFKHQNWDGAAYTDQVTGNFSHCSAFASYVNGGMLHLGVQYDYQFLIGASSTRFNTQMLGNVEGLLIMDQRKPKTLQGRVAGENFLVFTTDDPQVVEGIRKSRQLQLVLPRSGVVETYSLQDTFDLVPILANCVEYHLKNWQAIVRNNTQPAVPQASLSIDELYSIAFMLLKDMESSDVEFLSMEDRPAYAQAYPIAWSADGAIGVITSLGKEAGDLQQLSAGLTSSDAGRCEGTYRTGSTPVNLGRVPTRNIYSACEVGQTVHFIRYILFDIEEHIVMLGMRRDMDRFSESNRLFDEELIKNIQQF